MLAVEPIVVEELQYHKLRVVKPKSKNTNHFEPMCIGLEKIPMVRVDYQLRIVLANPGYLQLSCGHWKILVAA
jgi:hypothetical protein